MASFRIVSTPRGQAPEEVRKEWVGVVLPMKDTFDPGEGAHEHNFSLEWQAERSFVTVPVRTALEELEKKIPKAAQWFYDNLPDFFLSRDFSFGVDEVNILVENQRQGFKNGLL